LAGIGRGRAIHAGENQMMKMFLAAPIVALLASASYAGDSRTPLIDKMRQYDLHEEGTNCTGDYFRIKNNQMLILGYEKPGIVAQDITLSEGEGTVTMTDSGWKSFNIVYLFAFSPDEKFIGLIDIHVDRELTTQQWLEFEARTGHTKKDVDDFIDKTSVLPQFILCQRPAGS
jgi:hypothetical protein